MYFADLPKLSKVTLSSRFSRVRNSFMSIRTLLLLFIEAHIKGSTRFPHARTPAESLVPSAARPRLFLADSFFSKAHLRHYVFRCLQKEQ